MEEQWKQIKDYPNYEASDLGRIRNKKTKRIISAHIQNSGYTTVCLSNKGITKTLCVHRLVLTAFEPKDNANKLDVHHKDYDKTNNRLDNLEWTTVSGNMQYSINRGRFQRTEKWRKNLKWTLDKVLGKSIIGTNETTGETVFYKALNDCANDGFQPSCVSNCCTGKRKHHLGFTWRFANEV